LQTDSQGVNAKYTGAVNSLIQPHGFGYLQYNDGSFIFISSTLCNENTKILTAFQVRAHIWYHSSIHSQVFGHNSAVMRSEMKN
jgi:hypothetical protein